MGFQRLRGEVKTLKWRLPWLPVADCAGEFLSKPACSPVLRQNLEKEADSVSLRWVATDPGSESRRQEAHQRPPVPEPE